MSHPNLNSQNPAEPRKRYGVTASAVEKPLQSLSKKQAIPSMPDYGTYYYRNYYENDASGENADVIEFNVSKIKGQHDKRIKLNKLLHEEAIGAFKGYKVRPSTDLSFSDSYSDKTVIPRLNWTMVEQVEAEAEAGFKVMDKSVYNSLNYNRRNVGGIQAARNKGYERYENKAILPDLRIALPSNVDATQYDHDEIVLNNRAMLPILAGVQTSGD